MPLQISERVRAIGAQAQAALTEQFARIDEIAEYNTQKVLSAFQNHKVAEAYFQGTTGYGYDDIGREALGEIYAAILSMAPMRFPAPYTAYCVPEMCWFLPSAHPMIHCRVSLVLQGTGMALSKNLV